MKLIRADVTAYRVPVARPVATSFGVMRDRPAVFLRLEADDGAFGWGEIFANWPAAGAEHRARLLVEDFADLIFAAPVDPLPDFSAWLAARTHVRALQCGEWGPFRQVIAGLDTALHDLAARRAGLPLARFLAPGAARAVPVYASGIAIDGAAAQIAAARAEGVRAFKVKVGFDAARDLALLRELAQDRGAGERLFADANQAWDVAAALDFMARADAVGLGWIEEPLVADAPEADWARLAAGIATPLAGGENIAGRGDFDRAIAAGHLRFVQPDVAKWGGVSGCLAVARAALAADRVYCPHFLGGGIGLAASAHLLAAAGGPGLLELDVNPNPLRDAFGGAVPGGEWVLNDTPGLGFDDVPGGLRQYLTHQACCRA